MEVAEKFKEEMRKTKKYQIPVEPIVNHIKDRCKTDMDFRTKVLNKEKNLSGCIDYIIEGARKKLNNRNGALEDTIVYEMADNYFIDKKQESDAEELVENKEKEEVKETQKGEVASEAKVIKDKSVEDPGEIHRMGNAKVIITKKQKAGKKKEIEGQVSMFDL